MPRQKVTPAEIRPEDCATAWFALLESARLKDDFATAARAKRQLERLGVKVRFVTPAAAKGAGRE